MKLRNFWYGFLIASSLFIIGVSFYVSRETRNTDIIGGEVFTLALPLLIMKWKSWTVGRKRKERF